jgi:two-component system CheB/CheR fusion protein
MKTMTQKDKTKEEFIEEVRLLQKRIAELEIVDTESKKAKQIVGEARAYAESIIETVREPLIVLGDDLKVISANRSFYRTFKVNPKETKGRFIYDLGNRQWDIPKLRTLLEDILPKNSAFDSYEIEHDFETVGPKTMLLNARRIFREANKTQMILLAIEDITERKRLEEELKSDTEMKLKFTSMVSHELRSPLGSIKEGINLVLEGLAGDINDEQKDLLNTAKRNTDRLGRLINNVLDFQKIASGKLEYDIRESDINEIVQEVNKEMRLLATEKGLDLVVDADDNIPKIRFDKDRIVQVLTNLVSNAIKYTEKGSITISTKQEDDTVRVAVQDTGIGIKAEDVKKLFRVFEQLDSTRDKKKGGTGLGLAISSDIILAHKGKIWAESKEDKGSTFYFTIPRNLKNKKKLGEILIEEKKITENDSKKALNKQRE